jgi:hypothetical protein
MQTSGERVKIILMEWAAYPPHRDKLVGSQWVRCGLGRLLEGMQRYEAGLAAEVLVVINGAPPPPRRGLLGSTMQHLERRRIRHRLQQYAQLPIEYPFVEAVCFRDNRGQDFGAYDFGYQLLRGQGYHGDVVFMNSSVAGPYENGWLLKYRNQFYRHPNVGLCGIGLNSHDTSREPRHFAPHVQSYFLYTNMDVLERSCGPRLFDCDANDKLDIIRQGEIGVSARVLDAGYGITSPAYPEFAYRSGHPWSIPWGDQRYAPEPLSPANTI